MALTFARSSRCQFSLLLNYSSDCVLHLTGESPRVRHDQSAELMQAAAVSSCSDDPAELGTAEKTSLGRRKQSTAGSRQMAGRFSDLPSLLHLPSGRIQSWRLFPFSYSTSSEREMQSFLPLEV
jgi:hypothetical protein